MADRVDHFCKWRKSGAFAGIIAALQVKLDGMGLIDGDLWCVDGASVRAAAGAPVEPADRP